MATLNSTSTILAVSTILTIQLLCISCEAYRPWEMNIRLPSDKKEKEKQPEAQKDSGTRWALLVAGSQGFGNYRHQVYISLYSFFYSSSSMWDPLNPKKGML